MNQYRLITRIPTKKKIMALTFDDGSSVPGTLSILNILKENNVKSTFFLTGEPIDQDPDPANQILKYGHEIGNHSYNHPKFSALTAEEIKSQMLRMENSLINATNSISLKPLFRPPYGDYNSNVLDTIESIGYPWIIKWTIDSLDWMGISADNIVQRVLNNAESGEIVLMHLGYGIHTAEALPQIISGLHSMGYKLITISEMLSLAYPSPLLIHYVVKYEDTLIKISRYFKVSVDEIVKVNNISDPNIIHVNQTLIIPIKNLELTRYVVKDNDTLCSITERFGIGLETILKINNIKNPDIIYPGEVLAIPWK